MQQISFLVLVKAFSKPTRGCGWELLARTVWSVNMNYDFFFFPHSKLTAVRHCCLGSFVSFTSSTRSLKAWYISELVLDPHPCVISSTPMDSDTTHVLTIPTVITQPWSLFRTHFANAFKVFLFLGYFAGISNVPCLKPNLWFPPVSKVHLLHSLLP